jgi:hypothetical protein
VAAVLAATVAGCASHERRDSTRQSADIALAAAVRVEADGCLAKASVGAGSFIANEKVITVAHVVAGSDQVHVVLPDGSRADAKVVAIDRRKDLALLDVDVDTVPLRRGSMRPRARGTFVVYRDNHPVSMPFEAIEFVDINAPDIDHGGSSLRRGYELRAVVERGDSGSVLVTDGVATGVVFARSTATGGKAWAVDISEADALLANAGDTAVDVGECV